MRKYIPMLMGASFALFSSGCPAYHVCDGASADDQARCCDWCQDNPGSERCADTCAAGGCDCQPPLDGGADAGPDAGQPDAGPCGGCSGDAPLCREDGECVACLSDDECGTDAPFCDTGAGECASCIADMHCANPTPICNAGSCAGCMSNSECEGRGTDAPLCVGAACVQCTAVDRDICGGNVCDGSTNTCTTRPASSKGLCQECIADDECMDGQLCVPMEFGGTAVGNFCLWRQDASEGPGGSCTNVRPYRDTLEGQSIDGTTATVCSLRQTTCEALNQFDMRSCTTGAPPTSATDAECGIPDLDDGLCRAVDSTTNRCTTPCGSDDDCRPGFTCNTGATVPYCNF